MRILLFTLALIASSLAQAVTPSWVKSTTIDVSGTSPLTSNSIIPATAGDTLIVDVWATGGGTFGTPTNSLGSTVVQDVTTAHFEYLRVLSCASGSQTFSIPFTGFTAVFASVKEITPAVILDQAATENSGSSVNPLTNSLTPSQNNEFFLATVKTISGAITFSSWTNSFTQDRQSVSGPSLADAYLVQTSGPTSVNAQVTISTSEPWFAMLAAYEVYVPGGLGNVLLSGGSVVLIGGKPVIVP